MVFLEVILGVSLCLFVLAKWWQWSSRRFWMVNGVSYIPGIPFIGALKEAFLFKKSIGELILDLYNDEKTKNQPISGFYFFHKASLIIREPELIKRILVKDFNFFQDRRVATDAQSDTIGGNTMPLIKGENWKNIRSNISPIFTGVKMKNFYLLLKEVCEVFEEKLSREICIEKQYDIKELSGHLTVDMLAICAFGVNANSLNNSQSQFYEQARSISNFTWRRAINFCGCFFFPELASFLKFTMFPDSVNNFMRDSINYVMEQREQSGTKRNDLIDVLITMKNMRKDIFHGDILVAQAAVFLAAGFETTASATSFALYELAKHQDIQENLRKEILEELRNHGEVSYERINQMEYLQIVVLETLRLYPTLPFLDRVYMPTGDELYSLEPYNKFCIPPGMPVYIPALAIHRDPKFYPDPLKFNPERFRNCDKNSLNQYLFLAFGQGPRGCIGARFGMFQVKLAIISVLKNYQVDCCEETPPAIRMAKKSLIMQSEDPINLVFRKL